MEAGFLLCAKLSACRPWVGVDTCSELGLSPLLLASIVTLSGSHVFPGEIVAMSGLGSAPAVAMMVAGRWDLTLAALRDTDWMCAPGWAPAQSVRGSFSGRGEHALS